MIEIITFDTKGEKIDRAEAETPEAAVVAAKQMIEDVRAALVPLQGVWYSAGFYVEGKLVGIVREDVLWTIRDEVAAAA